MNIEMTSEAIQQDYMLCETEPLVEEISVSELWATDVVDSECRKIWQNSTELERKEATLLRQPGVSRPRIRKDKNGKKVEHC